MRFVFRINSHGCRRNVNEFNRAIHVVAVSIKVVDCDAMVRDKERRGDAAANGDIKNCVGIHNDNVCSGCKS